MRITEPVKHAARNLQDQWMVIAGPQWSDTTADTSLIGNCTRAVRLFTGASAIGTEAQRRACLSTIVHLMSAISPTDIQWKVVGGLGLDLFYGNVAYDHNDIDIEINEADLDRFIVRAQAAGYQPRYRNLGRRMFDGNIINTPTSAGQRQHILESCFRLFVPEGAQSYYPYIDVVTYRETKEGGQINPGIPPLPKNLFEPGRRFWIPGVEEPILLENPAVNTYHRLDRTRPKDHRDRQRFIEHFGLEAFDRLVSIRGGKALDPFFSSFPRNNLAANNVELMAPIVQGTFGIAYSGFLCGDEVCIKKYKAPAFYDGVTNPAEHEFERCLQAREDFPNLRNFLQEPLGVVTNSRVGPLFVSSLVKDFDGQISKPLGRSKKPDRGFADHLAEIFFAMDQAMQVLPQNILVQRISPGQSQPVLVDLAAYRMTEWYSPIVARLSRRSVLSFLE